MTSLLHSRFSTSRAYPNAIEDGRVSLQYKLELYPADSEVIAEAHYKLSLALEFASITSSGDDGANTKREEIDQDLRDEAVNQMDLAIKSFRLKLQGKEVEIATSASPTDNELIRKDIAEMKELIADMEQRLVDLRKNPIDPQELLGAPEANVLGGLFGAVLGETPEQTHGASYSIARTGRRQIGSTAHQARQGRRDDKPALGQGGAGSMRSRGTGAWVVTFGPMVVGL
ncbi:hypothetical protein NLG97_g7467 [Lecanicillium saksenae]|uniref:Uncharacterized protein n=1 Tax=Lecanicillium saksenae TaxID=468837 RepID=A0ACC1QPA3_9HYPO|nr:hypothetical protein NLG97_g7467 [Lecanicillium saksenae]